ncbi:hypothetical protein HB662_03020 [Roseomonas frigidaquae]|uniref:Uncharacterized protein n=1 Tax=Falsiroseomonas frigidaquae TaxID=487318 RepID=A0ABX1ETV3_9PROT|nr:hypothetical protein [Falsiroseomonas frigidaquae]NKE43733.1 hypothetical protein [Falsiroseomonas frigidaquae]
MRLAPPRLAHLLGCLLLLLCCAAVTTPALAQRDPSFNLVNRSGQPIREIYVSPSEDRYWGHDLLQADLLPDGGSFPLRLDPSAGCLQDVRVVYVDGRPEERRRQDTCRMVQMVFGSGAGGPAARGPARPDAVPQGRGNPSFNLVNHGAGMIREVYVSSVQLNNWGEDRLGEQVLPPGRHLAVRLPAGDCVNDVRIVWMDGRSEERRRLDTCALVNLVFQ